jgi:hypothetical protein
LFEVLGEAKSREEIQRVEPEAHEVQRRYMGGFEQADGNSGLKT